jgi:pimeloyl-ACP methyl ester carboxylesterase
MRRAIVIVLLLLAAALVVNAVVADAETRPAQADIGEIVELDGPDLQVREEGPEDAPAIVLVHCYSCSMKWWEPVSHHLAKDHRVVSVDLIGHGGSEKPVSGYEIDNQAAHVIAALDELDVERAVLAGHSMGGNVVTAMAEQEPGLAEGLVATGTPPVPGHNSLPLTAQIGYVPVLGEAIMRVVPDSMVEQGLASAYATGFALPDFALSDFRAMTYSAYDQAAARSFEFIDERTIPERLATLELPVLYIQGEEDQLVESGPAVEGWKSIEGAEVEVLPGVGHSAPLEAPQKTAELIAGFAGEAQKN